MDTEHPNFYLSVATDFSIFECFIALYSAQIRTPEQKSSSPYGRPPA